MPQGAQRSAYKNGTDVSSLCLRPAATSGVATRLVELEEARDNSGSAVEARVHTRSRIASAGACGGVARISHTHVLTVAGGTAPASARALVLTGNEMARAPSSPWPAQPASSLFDRVVLPL